MAVCAYTGPNDRYSAIPSMNHRGIASAVGKPVPTLLEVDVMSNWKA